MLLDGDVEALLAEDEAEKQKELAKAAPLKHVPRVISARVQRGGLGGALAPGASAAVRAERSRSRSPRRGADWSATASGAARAAAGAAANRASASLPSSLPPPPKAPAQKAGQPAPPSHPPPPTAAAASSSGSPGSVPPVGIPFEVLGPDERGFHQAVCKLFQGRLLHRSAGERRLASTQDSKTVNVQGPWRPMYDQARRDGVQLVLAHKQGGLPAVMAKKVELFSGSVAAGPSVLPEPPAAPAPVAVMAKARPPMVRPPTVPAASTFVGASSTSSFSSSPPVVAAANTSELLRAFVEVARAAEAARTQAQSAHAGRLPLAAPAWRSPLPAPPAGIKPPGIIVPHAGAVPRPPTIVPPHGALVRPWQSPGGPVQPPVRPPHMLAPAPPSAPPPAAVLKRTPQPPMAAPPPHLAAVGGQHVWDVDDEGGGWKGQGEGKGEGPVEVEDAEDEAGAWDEQAEDGDGGWAEAEAQGEGDAEAEAEGGGARRRSDAKRTGYIHPACQRMAEHAERKYRIDETAKWRLAEILTQRRESDGKGTSSQDMNRIAKYLERSEDASAAVMQRGDEWMAGPIKEPDFSAQPGSILRPAWNRKGRDGARAAVGGGVSGRGQGAGRFSAWKPMPLKTRTATSSKTWRPAPTEEGDEPPPWKKKE